MSYCPLPPAGSASGLGVHGAVCAVHFGAEALGVSLGPRGSTQRTHVLAQIGTQNISFLVFQPMGSVDQLRLSVVFTKAAEHALRSG